MACVNPNVKHVDQSFMRLSDWFKGTHSEEEIRLRLGNVSAPEKYDDIDKDHEFNAATLKEKEIRVEDTITRHEPVKQRGAKKEYKKIREQMEAENND